MKLSILTLKTVIYFFAFLAISTIILFLTGCSGSSDQNKIEASGTIETTEVTLSSKVSGEIKVLNADEGNEVKSGDTLLVVDHSLLDIQLEQALAARDMSEAQYALMKSGARREDITQASEALRQAQINRQQASLDRDRMEKLYASKSVTKKQYDDAVSRYDITQAQYNAAQENLSKMKNLARPEELRQANANVKRSDAGVKLLQKNISDCYVVSPVNGIIVKKYIERGESVMPSASLLKISDLSVVDLVIYVSEEELGKVKLGQKAQVSVDSYKDKVFTGKVIYISPEAEFTPKNIQTKDERTKLVFAVKIQVHNPEFKLKAGMPADAVISLQ